MQYIDMRKAIQRAILFFSCLLFLLYTQLVMADLKRERIDTLFRVVRLPLVDEADQIEQRMREDTGVCSYLIGLRKSRKLSKGWLPSNPFWEKAARIANDERALVLRERNEKYKNVTPWHPTWDELMKVTYYQFSDLEIDRLIIFSESDVGKNVLSWQDAMIALQIIGGAMAADECVPAEDRVIREQFVAKVKLKLSSLTTGGDGLAGKGIDRKDEDLLMQFLTHFLDKSFKHSGEWASLANRFNARIENLIADYLATQEAH